MDFPILGAAAAVTMANGGRSGARVVLNAVASSPLNDADEKAVEIWHWLPESWRALWPILRRYTRVPAHDGTLLMVKRNVREAMEEAGAE